MFFSRPGFLPSAGAIDTDGGMFYNSLVQHERHKEENMKKTMTLALAAAFAGAVFAQPENDDFTNAVQLAGTSGSVT